MGCPPFGCVLNVYALTRFTWVVQVDHSDVYAQSIGYFASTHLVAVAVDIRSDLLSSGSYTLLFN
ncbi:hypothetical protein EMIT0P218_50247 [Pseudomonas sp. IT-P218]